jgi:hypothetical protein
LAAPPVAGRRGRFDVVAAQISHVIGTPFERRSGHGRLFPCSIKTTASAAPANCAFAPFTTALGGGKVALITRPAID